MLLAMQLIEVSSTCLFNVICSSACGWSDGLGLKRSGSSSRFCNFMHSLDKHEMLSVLVSSLVKWSCKWKEILPCVFS